MFFFRYLAIQCKIRCDRPTDSVIDRSIVPVGHPSVKSFGLNHDLIKQQK